MSEEKVATPQQRKDGHHTDAIARKAEEETEAFERKMKSLKPKGDQSSSKQPAGGYDDTPIPSAPPGYTIKITFHRAHSLPFADLNSLSSDPFIHATLYTKLATRHKQDPDVTFRTKTIHRNTDPEWNQEWIIANVPASGFAIKARVYDEDPADHDDRLGNVHVNVNKIGAHWEGFKEQPFKIKKRMGSKRAYFFRGCAALVNRNVQMSGEVIISAELIGRTEGENGGQIYTVGPCTFSKHLSPMIGMLAGTRTPGKKGKGQRFNFQANQIQFAGPVPPELYHRYVEFKPFIKGMFTSTSIKGRILNRALHHQHARIYNFDRETVYGSFDSPSRDLTLQFLDLVHHDEGGRIFTYVITLDGQWRFTETGKEFGIDMLSKHSMHSDCDSYIAYSGEFFVRRLKDPNKSGSPDEQDTHPPKELEGGPPHSDPPKDPAYYVLIIDNDSGTYRPNVKLLPQLEEFLHRNLPEIKIITLDCQSDEEKMGRWKQEQRDRKKVEGTQQILVQGDASSISSSDISDIEDQERIASGQPKISKKQKLEMKMHLKKQAEEQGNEPLKQEAEKEIKKTEEDGRPMDAPVKAPENGHPVEQEFLDKGKAVEKTPNLTS